MIKYLTDQERSDLRKRLHRINCAPAYTQHEQMELERQAEVIQRILRRGYK